MSRGINQVGLPSAMRRKRSKTAVQSLHRGRVPHTAHSMCSVRGGAGAPCHSPAPAHPPGRSRRSARSRSRARNRCAAAAVMAAAAVKEAEPADQSCSQFPTSQIPTSQTVASSVSLPISISPLASPCCDLSPIAAPRRGTRFGGGGVCGHGDHLAAEPHAPTGCDARGCVQGDAARARGLHKVGPHAGGSAQRQAPPNLLQSEDRA